MSDSPRPNQPMSASPDGMVFRFAPQRALGTIRGFASAAALLSCVVPLHAAAHRRTTATHTAAPHSTHTRSEASARARQAAAAEAPAEARSSAARRGKAVTRTESAAEAALAAKAERLHGNLSTTHSGRTTSLREGSRAPIYSANRSRSAAVTIARESSDFTDHAADHSTEERVRAWYRARNVAAATGAHEAADEVVAEKSAPTIGSTAKTIARKPDLSPVPPKATVADFDRALQQRTQAERAAAAQAVRTTTAEDDAAASQIPSTAPTERVAAPFTHGDLLQSAAAANATSADFLNPPATVPGKAPQQAAITPKIPTTVHADPRSDAAALASADASAKPSAVKLQTVKPVTITRQAPAAAAVASAAAKPKLDPTTVDAITDQTFDSDDTPVQNAKAAVVIASRSAKPDPVARAVVETLDDDVDLSASGSAVKVNLYDPRGHLVLIPPMKGTHEILVHQNQMAVADGLDRIEDDDQLYDMRRLKLLVALPDNESIEVDDRLPSNRRYARPWSVKFLNDLGRAHYARFHTPLIITSAVRTVAFQRRLVLTNGNAAPPTGEVASPHLYGQALDIAKHGMSVTEIAWMRAYLTPVESEGKIDVEEEFQQACFHVSVYRRYLGVAAPSRKSSPEAAPSRVLQQAKAAPAPATRRHHLPTAILATGLR